MLKSIRDALFDVLLGMKLQANDILSKVTNSVVRDGDIRVKQLNLLVIQGVFGGYIIHFEAFSTVRIMDSELGLLFDSNSYLNNAFSLKGKEDYKH